MPRKLEPGLAATYSKFRALRTSTMKSPPGRSVVSTSISPVGSFSFGKLGADAGRDAPACGACAAGGAAPPANAAAPVTAALFRKLRRLTAGCFDIGDPP